jgi:hypothetical protein
VKKISKQIEEEMKFNPSTGDKHVINLPVYEPNENPEIDQTIDCSKIINISGSEKSESEEEAPTVQFSPIDPKYVDLFVSRQSGWSEDKKFRLHLWLGWFVQKLVKVDVKMEEYLRDYYREN